MKDVCIPARLFFNSKGELPWEVLGGEPCDWELTEKKIVPFGTPELVQVWENTNIPDKEFKD